ncbi:class I adenylate-forming enzyme family protein [Pseudarthrobacter sp. NPDC058196]|uniref:class I adenylate-forming enzyme family protein n=1 Tax=Pseudarthrobacter sp. NPDC058196 TaxID=3346376 RepID=UPI0036DB411E
MNNSSTEQKGCVSAFEKVAGRNPGQTAIIDGDRTLSYGDMQASIDRRAGILLEAGLKPGYRVALIAESSADYLVTALAVWRSGGVLVTVYPSSGPGDLEYAIDTSDPALIVTSESVDRALVAPAARNVPIVDIADFRVAELRHDASSNPEGLREPLAMICFSSGTTSRPKAIMLSATTIHNCADTYGEVWHLGPEDTAIICLPMAWLYGLASTSLAVLLRGGTVVVVRRARPEMIAPAIEKHRATFLAGVTATFGKLAQFAEQNSTGHPAFPSLRLCISGGEPRNEAAFSRWQAQTGLPVLDAYCASECLPLVTYDPISTPTPKPGSAGKLVPRSKLKVLDAEGQEVPAGQIGEAYSSGPGLMLGYWRDEEQTQAAITDDGWYRTKDLVRVDEDGFVYVVGRLSDVIIRGGTNISPAEVERVLQQHPSVAEAAVVGIPDDIYGQRVVAAIVPQGGAPLDHVELETFTAARLSSYKVPSQFITVDSLPVNLTTGKVSRRDVAALLSEEASTSGS